MPGTKRDRERARRARQYGDDGKREWVMARPCAISGARGTDSNPIDPAHISKTRGAGAGPERMLPLRRFPEHRAYDSMGAKRFEEVFGISKQRLAIMADELHEEWLEYRDGLAQ